MADNEIRNPAKAYFKWKMPVITKSEDDWNFWNTEDKYNRTMFIGYNDTTTPHVASLFMIVDGKPMQAVGDDVIARIAGLETNTAQALADIQALIDRVNAQQLDIDALKQECYRILNNAKDAVTDAQTWAEGTDEEVADLGGEHSAKGWAQKANDIVVSGLPSDVTFDHLTVTGSSKFGQDPDRENQPGLEIESTGEIQAYRTVNMMNGATVSYDETVEMPWSDSSNKVPNTAWVQQAVQHGTIDPNTELTVKSITTATNFNLWFKDSPKSYAHLWAEQVSNGTKLNLNVFDSNFGSAYNYNYTMQAGNSNAAFFSNPGKVTWLATGNLELRSAQSDVLVNAGLGHFVTIGPKLRIGGTAFVVDTSVNPITAAFGVTPTVPDIIDAADISDKAPNTRWVHDCITASTADFQPKLTAGEGIEISADNVISATGGGTGGGAVTSVNGKTGEVVLAAADVGAAPADALASYVTTDALNTELAGKQDKLTAESDLAVNNLTAASVASSGMIKATNADSSKYVQVDGTGLIYSSTGTTNYMHDITDYGLRLRKIADNGSQQTALIEAVSGDNAYLQTTGGFIFQKSSRDILDTLSPTTYVTMLGDEIQLFKATVCRASMPSATDASTTVPTTYWVQGAIAAKTANLQPKLTAGDGITISETNVISVTGGTGGGAVSSVNGKTGEVVLNAADVGAITGAEADTKITTALEPYAKTSDVTTTLEPYAKSADVTAEITAAVAPLATTEALTTGLAGKQDKLTAGSGIAISDTNVISATVSSPVDSVNGKTGAVVLTGEDVNIDATEGAATVKATIAAKQDAITVGTDLDVRSVKAHSTVVSDGTTTQYTMTVTGEGFELKDIVNDISWARLTPTELNVPSLIANGAPGVDTLLTCNGPAKIAALSSINNQYATGAFGWDINTTTDYNKFEVYNTYYTTDTETGSTVANRSAVLSIGGSPTAEHNTWIDFTATYMSFKGNTNFGETGMNHAMNFNGPSMFNNEATFTQNVTLGHGETTVEGEGGTSTTTPASLVLVEGDLVASGDATFNKGLSASGTVHLNDVTFWKEVSGGVIPSASYSYSTGAFDIGYLTSNDSGTSANRVTIISDSREANYGAVFNLPVTISDASFKRTSTLAADDNSTEVPTTAWVTAAIAASGGVPDDITCKTLKVTNWDGELDSIEFAGNLKYSGDYGNGSLGIITAREFFANSAGYYSARVRTSGITLTVGYGSTTWFKADSDTQTLTISGTLKSSTPAADANNTEVATTAWVNTAIAAQSATKPTLTYVTKSGTQFITTKVEQCTGGKLCTIYWRNSTVNNNGTYYIDVPTEFAGATIASTVFTSNDRLTPAVWVATSTLTAGKINLNVASTNTTSSTSASAIIVLAAMD